MKLNPVVLSLLKNQNDDSAKKILGLYLEKLADETHREVNNQLLRDLVLKYSAAERKLVELNQIKNRFLGMAAHDLRNPLVSIRGFSEILLSQDLGAINDDQKEFLAMINQASGQMLALVNDLLDVSAIESGKLSLKMQPGSLTDLIEERIRLNGPSAAHKNIVTNAALDPPPRALFDYGRLTQVVDNLIGNAIKFSQPGTEILVSLSWTPQTVKVSVRDQGPGLSEEDKSKIFGEFQRLSAQPTGGEKSTGLGLSIVKKIVEGHGGTIEVKDAPGQGSDFIFQIPLETQNARP
ncbi:MAG: HAMP domain-containing sensor histidine kinase [Pseudomonadota bacterium]